MAQPLSGTFTPAMCPEVREASLLANSFNDHSTQVKLENVISMQ